MVHCSGGAQTKILNFLSPGLHVVKDNMFPVPLLFSLIQEESGTSWREMYKVFNMGHRMEIYIDERHAQRIVDIASAFDIKAQVVGHVAEKPESQSRSVQIQSEYGSFNYSL
mmetsp:Transcript_5844/g.17511  ORF Transcript_5844/g.17511 Transcript_5844/m.17511 type:complete len:112 (-) Transcript_5844:1375-1710(-)